MNTWKLKTDADPLARTRTFLKAIWEYANLDGMVIPVYQTGHKSIKQTVIHDTESLQEADPFVPLMQVNASRMVIQLARKHPQDHMAAVLRPCEIRALYEQVKHTNVSLDNWLMIGVDCPACFPVQDFEWRVEKAGSVEELTRDVLRNVRQGGIALHRFRAACGMCTKPGSPHEDICIQLLGLPVGDTMLIKVNNEVILEQLDLRKVCDGPAPEDLVDQRDRMLKNVEERRQRIRERQLNDLGPRLPTNLDQLMTYLLNCQPCVSCMEACPVHADVLIPAIQDRSLTHEMLKDWLAACAECGMCEQACPKQMPLLAILTRVRREINVEPLAM
jgi:formate dehydrogenase subunit beta